MLIDVPSCVLKIREQKVKVLTPREAGYAIQLSNKTLLDVRPSTEHEKVCVLLNWLRAHCYLPLPHIGYFHPDNIPPMLYMQAWVRGSTWIPIFDVENTGDIGTLSKKITNFVMGNEI